MQTANVLVFIAPVSAFNQTLAEDPSVNRLVRSHIPQTITIDIGRFYGGTTVGHFPVVEGCVQTPSVKKGDVYCVAQQIRPSGREDSIWGEVSTVRNVVQGPAKQN